MLTTGRVLSITAMLGDLVVMSLSDESVRTFVSARPTLDLAVNVLGAAAAFGTFGAWGVGLYHWGTRYRGAPGARRGWGLALTLGMFLGAFVYWLTRRRANEAVGA